MRTDVIVVSSRGDRMESALSQADKVAAYKGMTGRNVLHLRLLAEEMLGMMRSITGKTEGKFWIEDDEQGTYTLHLLVETRLTSIKREQLLSAATSGKNESARGFMGRLRDFFERSTDEDIAPYTAMMPGMMEHNTASTLDWEWTMTRYQEELAPYVEKKDERALQAWDELEKSVVSHVADDVKVAIRSGTVEMIILKKLA